MSDLADEKYSKNYSESGLKNFIKKYAKKGGEKLLLQIYKLWYAMPDASKTSIAIIIAALGYAISPVDLVPDFIPVAGLADDLACLTAAVAAISSDITEDDENKAKSKVKEILG